jgi:hypothetical protein
MPSKIISILVITLLCGVACSKAGNVHTDPQGLVQFSIPSGWTLKSESNGMRFVPSDKPGEKTVLVVDVDDQDPKRTLDQQLDISRKIIRRQNAELITDQSFTRKGFSGWEQKFRLPGGAKIIKHTFYLYSDQARVEVYLIANADVYGGYLDDLASVVKSVH